MNSHVTQPGLKLTTWGGSFPTSDPPASNSRVLGLQDPILCSTGEQTEGFARVRQAIHNLSHSLSLCWFIRFIHLCFDGGSPLRPETSAELAT